MAYQVPKFLKRDGDALLFNQEGELIYYIPEDYFTRKIAEIEGEYVSLFGIFDYTVQNNNGKNNGLHRFDLPTVFICKPGLIEKVKGIKLKSYTDIQDYRLLHFRKGDQCFTSVKVPQSVQNAEKLFNMFIFSKIPNTIPYDEIQNYFIDNIHLNNADYGLSIQIFGVMVGESCRDTKDAKKLFRYTDMKNMNDYQFINIKQIPNYTSPFTAITSENWDESVVNAVLNKNTKDSPLEKLFMDDNGK